LQLSCHKSRAWPPPGPFDRPFFRIPGEWHLNRRACQAPAPYKGGPAELTAPEARIRGQDLTHKGANLAPWRVSPGSRLPFEKWIAAEIGKEGHGRPNQVGQFFIGNLNDDARQDPESHQQNACAK